MLPLQHDKSHSRRSPGRAGTLLLTIVFASPCFAGDIPDYGFQWAVIGDPGNRATRPEEVPFEPELQIGAVGYEYRMAKTEVTIGQWLEFVNAYTPHYTGSLGDVGFTGFTIGWVVDHWEAFEPLDHPARMSWEHAARYCNWLTNGKATTREAFERGAYDTSTFTRNPDGSYNHQLAHDPDAMFWIPTWDEWVKAAHWDPAKNGGEGGYWLYPTTSDTAPISGPPGFGETNAGDFGFLTPVGSYPGTQSPWGLLDTSGGVHELLESTIDPPKLRRHRLSKGTAAHQFAHD